MKVSFASTEELYREHRRTESVKKKAAIVRELQRRHDEKYSRPGHGNAWWWWMGPTVGWEKITRFDFAIGLPLPPSLPGFMVS
jgi:hypothetical protein